MKPNRFSRRRLLGTALAALTACLGIRRRRPAAAPSRAPSWPIPRQQIGAVTTYWYDAQGRLFAVHDPPSDHRGPTVSSYSCDA
jgi:hypothetical protein